MGYKPLILSRGETAYRMGVTTKALDAWEIEPCKVDGRKIFYDLGQVIKFRIKMLEPGEKKGLTHERTRIAAAKAETVELELKEKRGELLPASQVLQVWVDLITNARAKLLSLPSRAGQELIAATKIKDVEKVIRKYLFEALNELKDFNINDYQRAKESSKGRIIKL